MLIECSKERDIGIIKVGSSLTAATVDNFREQVVSWQAVEPEVKNFVADMHQVDFMDSAGLGALIAVLKRITERGGDMKIACLQKKPRMVFEITRAYKVFEIYDTLEDALKQFK
jgi:anti-sigma B factor antagonist